MLEKKENKSGSEVEKDLDIESICHNLSRSDPLHSSRHVRQGPDLASCLFVLP